MKIFSTVAVRNTRIKKGKTIDMDMFEKRTAAGIVVYDVLTQSYLMGNRADGQGWGFAAGKQEKSDVTIYQTAIRELKEEFGVVLTVEQEECIDFVKTILCQYDKIDREGKNLGTRHIFSNTYLLKVYGRDSIRFDESLKDDEATEVKWLSMAEICSEKVIFPPSLIALNVCRFSDY